MKDAIDLLILHSLQVQDQKLHHSAVARFYCDNSVSTCSTHIATLLTLESGILAVFFVEDLDNACMYSDRNSPSSNVLANTLPGTR